eukprot:CAMPEP_0114114182 /NCGR_PEP_ID=MMETSP0043_2-20121206/3302_1 /TAXON_ID=464988 /ORGANISM="Hemiselmis andersenii, Strain CCMP644" /LENGTH=98 /DNA_ID=CAMNT_0001206367 /DNA_START=58 /DNA_END=351 /DNA_ORIENTATION=-
MAEGEMIMWECDSVVAGRPFPLHGHSASLFLAYKMANRSKFYAGGEATEGSSKLHLAAAWGNIAAAEELLTEAEKRGVELHHHSDINDWQPLHEAARG